MKRFTIEYHLHFWETTEIDALSEDEAEEAFHDIMANDDEVYLASDGEVEITSIGEVE